MDNQNPDLLTKVKEMLSEFQKNSDKQWLRTQEAADYLGISTTQIHNFKREGVLSYSKLGGSLYFRRSDIDQILEDNLQEVN